MATFILPIEINRLPHHSCKTSHFLLVCRAKYLTSIETILHKAHTQECYPILLNEDERCGRSRPWWISFSPPHILQRKLGCFSLYSIGWYAQQVLLGWRSVMNQHNKKRLLNSKGTSSLPFRMEEVYESTQQEESETQRQMHMWWQWLGDKQCILTGVKRRKKRETTKWE